MLDSNNTGNAQAEFNLINGIYNGTITSADQIWSMVKPGGVNGKQALGALKLLNTEDRRDSQELDRGLSRLAGIPTMPGQVTVIDPKGAEFQRLQTLRANALEIQTQALRDGKVITPRQVLTQLETDLEKKRNSEEAKNARKQLDDVYSKKEWINGQITRETLPALKKKAGNDQNKLRELKRIEDLLNKSEGNQ
jgi:predicted nucleic acid-binding protein